MLRKSLKPENVLSWNFRFKTQYLSLHKRLPPVFSNLGELHPQNDPQVGFRTLKCHFSPPECLILALPYVKSHFWGTKKNFLKISSHFQAMAALLALKSSNLICTFNFHRFSEIK
jgi:hypothetical protein